MEYTKSLLTIIRNATRKYKDDIPSAVAESERLLRALPEYGEIVNTLVHNAIADAVYDCRHKYNVTLKRQTGCYGGKAIADVAKSKGLQSVYQSVYDMRIAGTILGQVYGRELVGLADVETTIGNGHYANALLLTMLAKIVPQNKQVRSVVSETKLRTLMKQSQIKAKKEAA